MLWDATAKRGLPTLNQESSSESDIEPIENLLAEDLKDQKEEVALARPMSTDVLSEYIRAYR